MPSPLRNAFASVLLLCGLAVPVVAQAPPADSAAKAAEADIKLGLREALRLTATDAAKAADRLQKLLTQLQSDRLLLPDRREQLTRVVKDQLRVAQAGPVAPTDLTPPPLPPEVAQRSAEAGKVKAGLEAAVELRKQGKAAEAGQRLADLTKQFPDNVAVQFLNGINQVTDRRDDAKSIQQDKDRGAAAALNSIDRSAVLPKGDIEFPKDFKEKTAKRAAANAPTAAELKILQSLSTSVNAKFNNSRLEDVMDALSAMMGLTIVIDKAALDDVQHSYDTPVTFALKHPVAARTALRAILSGLGLTYVVREGVVFVTTPVRARDYLVTKAYYLGDLVKPLGNPLAPFGDPLTEALNVASLIDIIVTSIDPDSWEARGGPGTIRYVAAQMAIVVRQSAEVQTLVRSSLYK